MSSFLLCFLETLILGTQIFNLLLLVLKHLLRLGTKILDLLVLGLIFLFRSCLQLFDFFFELVKSVQGFPLGLGHTFASCPDHLKVLGADYHLVVVRARKTIIIVKSYEVDSQILGIRRLAFFTG